MGTSVFARKSPGGVQVTVTGAGTRFLDLGQGEAGFGQNVASLRRFNAKAAGERDVFLSRVIQNLVDDVVFIH
jgi:hypothetical protein